MNALPLIERVLKSVNNPSEPPRKQRDIRRVCEALTIAWEGLRVIGHCKEYFESGDCINSPECPNCEANSIMRRISELEKE